MGKMKIKNRWEMYSDYKVFFIKTGAVFQRQYWSSDLYDFIVSQYLGFLIATCFL